MPSSTNTITDFLARESGRFGPRIYKETLYSSPWLALVPQETFPSGMGKVIKSLTYERTIPGTINAWENVSESAGEAGGGCLPPVDVVNSASTERTYQLAWKAIESQNICIMDTQTAYEVADQAEAVYDNLKQNVQVAWINRHRDEYIRLAEHKVTLDSGSVSSPADWPENDTAFPVPVDEADGAALTFGVLENFYMKMLYEGGEMNPTSTQDGRPIFTVITGAETSRRLRRMSNAGMRDDFRYTSDSDYILKPLGITSSYDGFVFTTDLYPPRYNVSGGAWVRVEPYVSAAATSGTKYIPNPDYHSAKWEDAVIYHKDVCTCLVPDISDTVGEIKVNPQNYRGDFDFKVIIDRTENPDGNWGFFRAKLANATKPGKPSRGFVIRHKRLISADIETTTP